MAAAKATWTVAVVTPPVTSGPRRTHLAPAVPPRAQRLLALATRLRRADATLAVAGADMHSSQRPPSHNRLPARIVSVACSSSPAAAAAGGGGAAAAAAEEASSADPSGPPVTAGDLLTLRCARLAAGGRGVCLTPSGFVVMVPRALPGELLRVRITTVRGRFAEGERLETIEQHTAAVPAPCPHFTEGCGGCPLQPLEYAAQLTEKRNSVVQLLARVGGVKTAEELVAPTVGAPQGGRLGYRNKLQFTFGSRVAAVGNGIGGSSSGGSSSSTLTHQQQSPNWALGFLRPGTRDEIIPITACLLQGPAANRALAAVQQAAVRFGLEPANAPSGRGVLRHCIIRSAGEDIEDDNTSIGSSRQLSSGNSSSADDQKTNGQATGVCLQVVIVTSRRCSSELMRPLAEAVVAAVPEVVSVVHSIETEAPSSIGHRSSNNSSRNGKQKGRRNSTSSKQQRRGSGGSGMRRGADRSRSSSDEDGSDSGPDTSDTSRSRGGARPLRVDRSVALTGPLSLDQQLSGLQFSVGPHSFFQTSTAMAEVLYQLVADAIAAALPSPLAPNGSGQAASSPTGTSTVAATAGPPVVLDLYTGTGTIALTLARRLAKSHGAIVWGADVDAAAIADAARNAAANGVTGAAFVCGDLDALAAKDLAGFAPVGASGTAALTTPLPRSPAAAAAAKRGNSSSNSANSSGNTIARPAAVVVDPARAGLGPPVIEFLRRCRAPVIVYVSCNPATQARDVARLAGAYEIVSVTPVDMFPQTEHVETVAVLRRL